MDCHFNWDQVNLSIGEEEKTTTEKQLAEPTEGGTQDNILICIICV